MSMITPQQPGLTPAEQTAIIRALGGTFSRLIHIDLTDGSWRELSALTDAQRCAGTAQTQLNVFCRHMAHEEDRAELLAFVDLTTLEARLADTERIAMQYRGAVQPGQTEDAAWRECVIMACGRTMEGRPTRMLLADRGLCGLQNQAFSQQRRLEQALAEAERNNRRLRREIEFANALTVDYPDVMLADLENDSAVTIKRRGRMLAEDERRAKRSYADTWAWYILRYVVPEDRETLTAAVSAERVLHALADADEYACSYRVAMEDGRQHYYQVVFCRVHADAAMGDRVIFSFRNVDAIVEAEGKHTRIQEEQLRIIDALSREYHSLFKVDSRNGDISLYRTDGIGMDTSVLQGLLGTGAYEDVLTNYVIRFVVPEDQARILEGCRLSVLMERVPEIGLYKQGYRRCVDGVMAYYEITVVKTCDDAGNVVFILGMRDVDDEMKRQLRQIRRIEAQDEVIEGLASVYYSVLLVNPATDRVTVYRAHTEDGEAIATHFLSHGYRWSEGLRSYAEELIPEGSRSEFLQKLSLERIRAAGEDYSVTYEKLTGHGVTYLQCRVSFVHERDGQLAVVVGTRTIDDLIKRERQQEMALREAYDVAEAANRAKTDFLSNMSHDIRTPMNGIIGMTAIAAAHIDDRDRVADCLQKITLASKHLLSLINEVLDMSKIESGKVTLMEENFNLSDLIDNLLTMTSAQIEEHRHQLSVNTAGVIHEAVIGDSLRIQKVFTNLMGNAVKYTPDGGRIKLTITEKPSRQSKVGCYEFVFEDNGIGMTREFIQTIFEPFARATDSRVHRVQGTGLGMPISRSIVRMMGGDIEVESEPGVGSRFTVTMYLKLQDQAELRYDQLINLDVLVADDDPLSLESCCGMLSDLGMRPEGVTSGAEAIREVVRHHDLHEDYFACIVDWKMPDMDGIATARAIRRTVGRDVPIIIITAYDWSEIEQEARAAGVDAFISKPVFRSRLARTFAALVGAEEQDFHEPPLAGIERLDLTGRRALLVEDNELNAEIAVEIMSMTGLTVECAADGIEAVDRMAACPDGYYDVVFMDIQMPRMNGYDATRAIRAMNRSYCRQVPIIAMTANAFAEDVLAAKTVGMNEHVAKPLDLDTFARMLQRYLL